MYSRWTERRVSIIDSWTLYDSVWCMWPIDVGTHGCLPFQKQNPLQLRRCHLNAFSFSEVRAKASLCQEVRACNATESRRGCVLNSKRQWCEIAFRVRGQRHAFMPSAHWKKWSRWQESMQHVNCTIEIEGNNFSFDLWIDLHVFFLLKASSKQITSKSRGKELVNGKWDSVKGSNVFKFQLQDTVHTSHSINSQSYNVLSSEKLLQLRLWDLSINGSYNFWVMDLNES